MALVIALDAGTTGVRAIAFDEGGRARASSYREFPQHFPRPGWVEHDADEIWDAVALVLAEVAGWARGEGEVVAALGITDQRETVVAWSRASGRPVHRAIVWQDRRTASRCDDLREAGHLPTVRRTTGLVLDPYFSASKLEWLFTTGGLEAGEDVAVGTVDAWLLWKLTDGAVHATDVTNASRTMLLDISTGTWSPEMADLFGVPLAALPEVRPSSGRIAMTRPDGPLGAAVPVSGVAGDQQAALFGQACFEPGTAKNTYGTGSFVLMNVGRDLPPIVDGLLTTVAWGLDGHAGTELTYAYEGAIFVTGAAVQWLRDGLGIIDRADEVGSLAATVSDSEGVVLVPAFTGLGSPWWDPYARGTLLGVTRGTGRGHLARAVLDAMAFQTRDVVDAMERASGRRLAGLRVDGGATATTLLLQLQADQLGVPVARPVVQDTTALGAAYLAGLAEGVWGSLADVTANWTLDVEARPSDDRDGAAAAYARWLTAVERSRRWADTT